MWIPTRMVIIPQDSIIPSSSMEAVSLWLLSMAVTSITEKINKNINVQNKIVLCQWVQSLTIIQ